MLGAVVDCVSSDLTEPGCSEGGAEAVGDGPVLVGDVPFCLGGRTLGDGGLRLTASGTEGGFSGLVAFISVDANPAGAVVGVVVALGLDLTDWVGVVCPVFVRG